MMYGVVVCGVVGHSDALDGLVVNDVVFTVYDDFVVLPAKKLFFSLNIILSRTYDSKSLSICSFSFFSNSRVLVDSTMPMSKSKLMKYQIKMDFLLSCSLRKTMKFFFKRFGFESISNLLLNKFHSNLPNTS